MDALSLIKQQHDEVDALFETIEKARSADRKREVFAELADKLTAHAEMEEKVFYPAVQDEDTEEDLRESLEEHLSFKRILSDMLALDPASDEFEAKLSVLKEQVEHHAREEEEKELFPKVRKLFGAEELEELGEEMLETYEDRLEDEPRFAVKSQTRKAATL